MFASSSSGPSGPQGSYVPSFLIRKRLESEQEAERKRQEERTNGSHWPGPQEVLEPGYRSGPLGYIPNASQSLKSRQILGDTDLFYDASSFDAGVGLGLDALNSRPREAVTPMLYPDLHGGNTTHRQSISQPSTQQSPFTSFLGDQGRRSIMKEDVLKKNSSVRFSGVPDSPRQQPTTPSVFGTSGSSPFFSSSQLGSTSLSNLSGSGKEEKIDVLSHRTAPDTTLNRSLGPAPGSVSGASQATQGYSTRIQSGDLNGSALRDTGYSTSSSGAKSPFLMNQDGSRRQGLSGASKGLNEEEEDKDKERYMPGFLLNSGQGLKGAKVEPFIEANGSGYSDSFQQADGSDLKDAYPRQSTQQVGDDAPPQDTLDDLARKENFYQVSRPIRFEAPKADTRQDPHILTGSTERAKTAYDTIITYGFPADAASYILNQFRSFGTVIRHQAGIYSSKKDAFNWLLIQYSSEWSAKNATSRHLKPVGKFYVGVFPYTPAPTAASPSAMDVDSREDELQLSEADAMELQAGVNALMTMRDTAAVDASSPFSTLAKSTSQPGAGLGNSRLGQSQSSFSASIFNATPPPPPPPQDEGRRTTSGGDSGEEDLAHILGHSLSAGGVFGRSRRENSSLAKDALQASVGVNSSIGGGGASQDPTRNAFGESVQDSWTQEGSVGFKPLFGLGESRGLNTNVQDTKQHQQQQHHHHHHHQQSSQELSGSHRLSIRRQFEDSAVPGPIFGESGTTLFGNVGSSSLSGVSGSGATPFGIQKKQRLTLNTFSASAPASSVPGQFGPDRKSFLVDDPSLVDEYGQPKGVGPTNGGGGETMVGGFINTVKKRLFWG